MTVADELHDFLTGLQTPQEPAVAPVRNQTAPTTSKLMRAVRKLLSNHDLRWEPGGPGKGFFDSRGTLHTWPVDDNYEPNHVPWADENGVSDYDAPYLYINPDGRTETYGVYSDIHRQNLDKLWKADPRLRPVEDEWDDLH